MGDHKVEIPIIIEICKGRTGIPSITVYGTVQNLGKCAITIIE